MFYESPTRWSLRFLQVSSQSGRGDTGAIAPRKQRGARARKNGWVSKKGVVNWRARFFLIRTFFEEHWFSNGDEGMNVTSVSWSNLSVSSKWAGVIALCLLQGALIGHAAQNDEFKVKRESVFKFATKPSLSQAGDRITITFESQGFCDATIAIEDTAGKIIRHLASGVLGPNAPAPFRKNAKKQTVIWDGKDDLGKYIDDKSRCIVRVSLGLKPQFERTLFWSPKKRVGPGHTPRFASGPEGVYVHDGGGVDHIRLFDHEGNYLRTVYPFPPDRSKPEARSGAGALKAALSGVRGLQWMKSPQDGLQVPIWHGLVQATLFTSGDNTGHANASKYGRAASAMALHGKHLTLIMKSMNRVATDGTTGGLELQGPQTSFPALLNVSGKRKTCSLAPRSAAFSPDGKTVYITGFRGDRDNWLHGVAKFSYRGNKAAEVFVGSMALGAHGTDNAHFRTPMSVACDGKGRVYVADYGNDRIQIFDSEGKHLKTIANVIRPVNIFIHPDQGHIYVASWQVLNRFTKQGESVPARLFHYGPLENPEKLAAYPLPFVNYNGDWRAGGLQHGVFVDFFTTPPSIWVIPGTGDTTEKISQMRASGLHSGGVYQRSRWSGCHVQIFREDQGKLVKKTDFAQDVARAIHHVSPPQAPACDRQRMYVNPSNGKLYVAEGDSGVGKSFRQLLEIQPDTGKVTSVALPLAAEDMAFDMEGHIYLRTAHEVARYCFPDFREVPYDYGEERVHAGFDMKYASVIGAIVLPGSGRPGCFHMGGFNVSPNGDIVVHCYNVQKSERRSIAYMQAKFKEGKPYTPKLYPGRATHGEVHVWNRHGKLVQEDTIQGLPRTDGVAMDRQNNLYILVAANRVLDGNPYPLERAQTLMKFRPLQGKIVSSDKRLRQPLPEGASNKRPFDIEKGVTGRAWVEGAEWLYGGVGYGGFQSSKGGGGCACWNARAGLDLFARSFAAELNRFRVAVLDSNGNLILRIGKYGNVDDGLPLIPEGGPARPRAVGGDEVALCQPRYLATHTDRHLFIADYGNYRILSVKLGYHQEIKMALKSDSDRSK